MQKEYFVYIMASGRNGTLYVGVTNDLARRVGEHRDGLADSFTKKYAVKHLVYFETFGDVNDAIYRESQIKKYEREWKMNLIQRDNVEWRDLAADWTSCAVPPGWPGFPAMTIRVQALDTN